MITPAKPPRLHDAPWLCIDEPVVLRHFCERTGIKPLTLQSQLINQIAAAFAQLPYENLTKIVKAESVLSAASAMRYPSEVLRDFLEWGAGGTCFALTAAAVAVFDALGIAAHPVLADRSYGVNTHCGVIIPATEGVLLFDPGYLLCTPTVLPHSGCTVVETGFNQIELSALGNGSQVALTTIVKNNRKLRMTFKIEPVSDETFATAWKQSFAFEMMTYPVLTRSQQGCHYYLQGTELALRTSVRTARSTLSSGEQIDYITSTFGIRRDLVVRALAIVNYGANAPSSAR